MPRLIVLNGPPGCGKSTLAQMWVTRHPRALNLDIDQIRSLLGDWKADPYQAGPLARELAKAMARTHLLGGHDVVVAQYLGRLDFIEQLEAVAQHADAGFTQIVLLASKDESIRRFELRTERAAEVAHVEAAEMVSLAGGRAELAAMYDRLEAVIAARPDAIVVRTRSGEVQQAYDDVAALLA